MPAVPLFALPDISLLSASQDAFVVKTTQAVGTYRGLRVEPAKCDKSGKVLTSNGALAVYGDGRSSFSDGTTTKVNEGDGSGSYSNGDVTIVNNGNGSGTYSDGQTTITTKPDGSGTYSDGELTVTVDGRGAGTYSDGTRSIENDGKGSGTYSDLAVTIVNKGDGSGTYSDGELTIENHGDGTGTVDGTETPMQPLNAVPPVGKFPPITALTPAKSCGLKITVDASILFDFDKSDLRSDAADTVTSIANALRDLDIPAATITGHTDSIGADDYNLQLSTARARSLLTALEQRGVTTALTAVGQGERQPIAANQTQGRDNPAGRQLNRRVEIYIPTQP